MEMRFLLARKKREQTMEFEKQLAQRDNISGPMDGVFVETQRYGRRAREV